MFAEAFQRGWPRKFCSETFYNGYKNLIQMPNKFVRLVKKNSPFLLPDWNTLRSFFLPDLAAKWVLNKELQN